MTICQNSSRELNMLQCNVLLYLKHPYAIGENDLTSSPKIENVRNSSSRQINSNQIRKNRIKLNTSESDQLV
jgi:hypothetical protein